MQKVFLLTAEERERVCNYCSKNLRSLRKAIGLLQEELASAVGTTQRRISEIETGKAAVSWTLMLAFSTVFVLYPQIWKKDEILTSNRMPSEVIAGVRELESLITGLKANL